MNEISHQRWNLGLQILVHRECADGRNLTAQQGYRGMWTTVPHFTQQLILVGCSPREDGPLCQLLAWNSHPERWCNHRLEGSKLGFWVRWEQCFLLLGKGYIRVLSQFAHLFLYERNPTLRGNCDSIRQSGRLKTSVKLASIHNVKHGGPLPFSFEVSTHLETLYTLCIHSRSTPLNKPHRLVPKTISILPPSSLSTNLNSKSCQSILSSSI